MGALGLAVGIFHYLGLYLQLGAASRPPPWDAPAEGSGERGHRAVGGQRGWGRLPGGGRWRRAGARPGIGPGGAAPRGAAERDRTAAAAVGGVPGAAAGPGFGSTERSVAAAAPRSEG